MKYIVVITFCMFSLLAQAKEVVFLPQTHSISSIPMESSLYNEEIIAEILGSQASILNFFFSKKSSQYVVFNEGHTKDSLKVSMDELHDNGLSPKDVIYSFKTVKFPIENLEDLGKEQQKILFHFGGTQLAHYFGFIKEIRGTEGRITTAKTVLKLLPFFVKKFIFRKSPDPVEVMEAITVDPDSREVVFGEREQVVTKKITDYIEKNPRLNNKIALVFGASHRFDFPIKAFTLKRLGAQEEREPTDNKLIESGPNHGKSLLMLIDDIWVREGDSRSISCRKVLSRSAL